MRQIRKESIPAYHKKAAELIRIADSALNDGDTDNAGLAVSYVSTFIAELEADGYSAEARKMCNAVNSVQVKLAETVQKRKFEMAFDCVYSVSLNHLHNPNRQSFRDLFEYKTRKYRGNTLQAARESLTLMAAMNSTALDTNTIESALEYIAEGMRDTAADNGLPWNALQRLAPTEYIFAQ